MEVVGVKCVNRGQKTWGECEKDGMKLLGLQSSLKSFQKLSISSGLYTITATLVVAHSLKMPSVSASFSFHTLHFFSNVT